MAKAVEWGVIADHPLRQLKLLKIDSLAKVRYLDKGEEARLKEVMLRRDDELKNARSRANEWRRKRGYNLYADLSQVIFADYMTPMILLSLNTGLRQGELFNLEWGNVDLDRAIITVVGDTAKSGKTRHIPLNTIALQILNVWRRQTVQCVISGYIFTNQQTGKTLGNVRNAWMNILKLAGIENFRWHDMRHHFASKLVMNGVDLNTVRELLGHSDIKMTLRYAHLAPEHKANAVAKLL